MRAPVLLFGAASVAVFPVLVRGQVGLRVASAFSWLLAVAPLQIYFSRYVRPTRLRSFSSSSPGPPSIAGGSRAGSAGGSSARRPQ